MVHSETPGPAGGDQSLGDLVALAAFVGCLVLVLLCVALAFGLVALGIWEWAAFLIVAAACILLAGLGVGLALLKLHKLSGLRVTRKTVTEGLGMLRHDSQHPEIAATDAK